MRKSLLLLLNSIFILSGCTLNKESVRVKNSSGEEIKIIEVKNSITEEQEYKQTIKFSGTDFNVIATDAGVQIDDTNFANNAAKLKDYCDSFLDYENLITGLNCTKLNTAKWENKTYLCIGTGYYGNDAFKPGKLKWTSGEKIYRVEIKVQAYAKENSYSGNIYDYVSHISIDNDDNSLEFDIKTEPTLKTFSKNYEEGVNTFSISSTGGRVLLEEMTITWRG